MFYLRQFMIVSYDKSKFSFELLFWSAVFVILVTLFADIPHGLRGCDSIVVFFLQIVASRALISFPNILASLCITF